MRKKIIIDSDKMAKPGQAFFVSQNLNCINGYSAITTSETAKPAKTNSTDVQSSKTQHVQETGILGEGYIVPSYSTWGHFGVLQDELEDKTHGWLFGWIAESCAAFKQQNAISHNIYIELFDVWSFRSQ